jgi:tetratricopeptide (TPR) repeat protein
MFTKKQMQEERESNKKPQKRKKSLVDDQNGKRNSLIRFRKLATVDSAAARKVIKQTSFKIDPYLLQCIALTYFDESLFGPDGNQRDYFLMSKLRLAKKYIDTAYALSPNCIDVLWMKGKIYKALNQTAESINCFEQILKLGRRKLSDLDTCSDRELLEVKVNDSRFQLYRLYFDINKSRSSMFLRFYKLHLKQGVDTLYKPLQDFLL